MVTKVDFSKLSYHDEPLSMEEALKDVVPLNLPDEVINGEKKLTAISTERERSSNCVKLEMSY